MFELKSLTLESVDGALAKVERYRLLNEPLEAESICLDILELDPDHQQALVMLLLSMSDQFGKRGGAGVAEARALLPRLKEEYHRAYYAGIICERRGKSILETYTPGTGPVVYDWLREAMEWYEKAEKVRRPGNDEALLRWNTCARMIMRDDDLRPAPEEEAPTFLE